VSKDEELQIVKPEPAQTEPSALPMLLRVVGMFSLVLFALTAYFAGVAEYLYEPRNEPAEIALIQALRVMAGACAISGMMVGLFVLNRRDDAILQARRATRNTGR
jgi:hypothetical protein